MKLMKLFISLILSFSVSLVPLYSSAEVPDLMPIYETSQIDQEALKNLLSDSKFTENLLTNLQQVDFAEVKVLLNDSTVRGQIAKSGVEEKDIEQAVKMLNDPAFIEEYSERVAKLDVEQLQTELQQVALNSSAFQAEISGEKLNSESFLSVILPYRNAYADDDSKKFTSSASDGTIFVIIMSLLSALLSATASTISAVIIGLPVVAIFSFLIGVFLPLYLMTLILLID